MSLLRHATVLYGTKVPISVTKPYNADFDGDEMNKHNPRGLESRIECRTILHSSQNILSSQNGNPVLQICQDGLMCFHMMVCNPEFEISRRDFVTILLGTWLETDPNREKVFSYLTTRSNESSARFEWLNEIWWDSSKFTDRNLKDISQHSQFVGKKVKGLVLLEVLFKLYIPTFSFGKKILNYDNFHLLLNDVSPKKYLNAIVKYIGTTSNLVQDFISDFNQITDRVYIHYGSSYGFDDVRDVGRIGESGHTIEEFIKDNMMAIDKQIMQGTTSADETLFNLGGDCLRYVNADTRNASIREGGKYLSDGVRLARASGAKGGATNESFMKYMLGQQVVSNDRPSSDGLLRLQPCFPLSNKNPNGSLQRGFIRHSYTQGLSPSEAFVHAQAGREGQSDTSEKVPDAGYAAKQLAARLDSCLYNDGTVRSNSGRIIAFSYSTGNIDPENLTFSKTDNFYSPIDFSNLENELLNRVHYTKLTRSLSSQEIEHILSFFRGGVPGMVNDVTNLQTYYLHSYLRKELENFKIPDVEKIYSQSDESSVDLSDDDSSDESVSNKVDNANSVIISTLIEKLLQRYYPKLSAYGTHVGILAATSISNPSAQLGLDGKHLAGRGKDDTMATYIGLINCTNTIDSIRVMYEGGKFVSSSTETEESGGSSSDDESCDIDIIPDNIHSQTHFPVSNSSMVSAPCAAIPYPNHNQSPRNTYGGSMSRQAISNPKLGMNNILSTNPNYRKMYVTKPLLYTHQSKHNSSLRGNDGTLSPIVAICGGGYGYTQEDCICIREEFAVTCGVNISRVLYTRELGIDENINNENEYTSRAYRNIDPETGIIRVGSVIEAKDVLACISCGVKDRSFTYDSTVYTPQQIFGLNTISPSPPKGYSLGCSIVQSVSMTSTKDDKRLLQIGVIEILICEEADKFTGKHGQKGVCRYLSTEDMPFTDDGVVADIMINTLAFPSRMTQGMALEAAQNKSRIASVASGKKFICDILSTLQTNNDLLDNDLLSDGSLSSDGELTDDEISDVEDSSSVNELSLENDIASFLENMILNSSEELVELYSSEKLSIDPISNPDNLYATPFVDGSLEKLSSSLDALDSHGKVRMRCGESGSYILNDVCIAPLSYLRLKHLVTTKFNVRHTGPKISQFRTPPQGRKRNGGQTYSTLGRNAILANGGMHFSNDRLCSDSDMTRMGYCKKCQSFSTVVLQRGNSEGFCKVCKSPASVKRFSYTTRWLVDMVTAQGVQLKINLSND